MGTLKLKLRVITPSIYLDDVFEGQGHEVRIPSDLPTREYVFLWGQDDRGLRGYADDFEDICDFDPCSVWESFVRSGSLTIWRSDRREMTKNEIFELRDNFLGIAFVQFYPQTGL